MLSAKTVIFSYSFISCIECYYGQVKEREVKWTFTEYLHITTSTLHMRLQHFNFFIPRTHSENLVLLTEVQELT